MNYDTVWPRLDAESICFSSKEWPVVATATATHDRAINLPYRRLNLHYRCSMDVRKHEDGRLLVLAILVEVLNDRVKVIQDVVGPYKCSWSSAIDAVNTNLTIREGLQLSRPAVRDVVDQLVAAAPPLQIL